MACCDIQSVEINLLKRQVSEATKMRLLVFTVMYLAWVVQGKLRDLLNSARISVTYPCIEVMMYGCYEKLHKLGLPACVALIKSVSGVIICSIYFILDSGM